MLSINRAEPYRVFLVEDNPAEVRLIQEAVKEAELAKMLVFDYAYDGEEAMEKLDEMKYNHLHFDLVLLDLNLPKLSGKDVLEKIKSDSELETTPVIVVTNSDYKKDMIDCYRLGADGYLQKPADFKKLVDFFVSVKKSIEIRNKLSIYFIEHAYYDHLDIAV
ncbi:MAG: response regulator [Bacteroidetes bacterium]|nr:response regulator [Bacteroidota bacterium]